MAGYLAGMDLGEGQSVPNSAFVLVTSIDLSAIRLPLACVHVSRCVFTARNAPFQLVGGPPRHATSFARVSMAESESPVK